MPTQSERVRICDACMVVAVSEAPIYCIDAVRAVPGGVWAASRRSRVQYRLCAESAARGVSKAAAPAPHPHTASLGAAVTPAVARPEGGRFARCAACCAQAIRTSFTRTVHDCRWHILLQGCPGCLVPYQHVVASTACSKHPDVCHSADRVTSLYHSARGSSRPQRLGFALTMSFRTWRLCGGCRRSGSAGDAAAVSPCMWMSLHMAITLTE
jgi:hypothetical protein